MNNLIIKWKISWFHYGNVSYADLSDFFYVWLRRSLTNIWPEIFSTMLTPKSGELVATPFKFHGDRKKAEVFFEDGLRQVFKNFRSFGTTDYPVTVFYAFKQTE